MALTLRHYIKDISMKREDKGVTVKFLTTGRLSQKLYDIVFSDSCTIVFVTASDMCFPTMGTISWKSVGPFSE